MLGSVWTPVTADSLFMATRSLSCDSLKHDVLLKTKAKSETGIDFIISSSTPSLRDTMLQLVDLREIYYLHVISYRVNM